jgi:hypothetical protein
MCPANRRFCLHRQAADDRAHHVHSVRVRCPHLPEPKDHQDLGYHFDWDGAVNAARRYHSEVRRCPVCCRLDPDLPGP